MTDFQNIILSNIITSKMFLEHYPFSVITHGKENLQLYRDRCNWCIEQVGDSRLKLWCAVPYIFYFKNEEDAIAFSLTWA